MNSKLAYITLVMLLIACDSISAFKNDVENDHKKLDAPEAQAKSKVSQVISHHRQRRDSPDLQQPTQYQQSQLQQQTEQQQRNRLADFVNSRYMPTQDQLVQLLVILIIMALGPMAGASAPMIEQVVRQVLPLLITAAAGYMQQQNGSNSQSQLNNGSTQPFNSQLVSPVEPPRSFATQSF